MVNGSAEVLPGVERLIPDVQARSYGKGHWRHFLSGDGHSFQTDKCFSLLMRFQTKDSWHAFRLRPPSLTAPSSSRCISRFAGMHSV